MKNYQGITQPLAYELEAKRENPCLAVSLAMLTESTDIDGAHQQLVAEGISDETGQSMLPPEGTTLTFNDSTIGIDEQKAWFSLDKYKKSLDEGFEAGKGSIVGVRLNEEGDSDASMHLILLAGKAEDKIAVGDSLVDGVQMVETDKVFERLERTLDFMGALMSHTVSLK